VDEDADRRRHRVPHDSVPCVELNTEDVEQLNLLADLPNQVRPVTTPHLSLLLLA
jgi:hypothetical protein